MLRKLGWFGLVLVVLLACGWMGRAAPTPPGALETAVAQTVQAQLGATFTPPAGGAGPPPTPGSALPTNTLPPALTQAPTRTPAPALTQAPTWTPSPSPLPCNLAHFVADVTVPDGTAMAPGEAFTKTWRLQNVGSCPWENYSLVFDHGDRMGGPTSQPIPAVVPPGGEVDVSVDLVAPATPGTYQGFWKLRDPHGAVFGLTTGSAFWVKIKVVAPTETPTTAPTATPHPTDTPTATATLTPSPALPPPALLVLDFYGRAPEASWYNGSGDALPFPGAANDSRGFARYADGLVLEDGNTYTHVLETHPEWVDDGSIIGHYPAVTLPSGAHFRAKIGFIAQPDGTCGVGEVEFQLLARFNGGMPVLLGSWHKDCTGALQRVDVDLSSRAGATVIFSLRVQAAGTSAQDWAVWVNPVVSTP